MLDVIVIGAGPIGSRIAERLAFLGYATAVLEKRSEIGEKPCCTGIISQECVSKFSITSEVIYNEAQSAKIYAPSGELIRVYRPQTQACVVNRRAFDKYLAGLAKSRGVKYHLQCQAERISINPDKVIVEVNQEGQAYQLEAQVIILASGFNSALVKKQGLGQPGYCVTGAQAEVMVSRLDEVEVYFDQNLAPGFFAWLVPTSKGKALAGLMTRDSPGLHLRQWIKQLESQGRVNTELELPQIRYSGIPLKSLIRTSGERLLVVGDAAGQVKPTTGGGIYFGLLCADKAVETIHRAFQKQDFSAKYLSQYDNAWREMLGHELRREYLARRIYERLSNKQIDMLFSVLNSSDIVESLMRDDSVSFDWHGGLMLKVLKSGLQSQVRKLFRISQSTH